MAPESGVKLDSVSLAERLSDAGYRDVLVLKRDTAQEVLTDKRMEIVEVIKSERPDSIRELSRITGRDVGAVHRDLDILFQHEIIRFREEGGRKIPEIAHENVIVEPLI